MIIQCEKCQTKFRLDDSRVTGNGVKVRCTKCKHVFTVRKDEPDDESLSSGLALPFSPPVEQYEVPAVPADNWNFAAEPESAPVPSTESIVFEDTTHESEPSGSTPPESTPFDASEISFDTEDYDVSVAESTLVTVAATTSVRGEVDFSDFDFGDTDSGTEPHTSLSVDDFTDSTPAIPLQETPQGLDFSDDDMFGTVVQATPETSSDTITFDFEGDSFAESMDINTQDSSGKGNTPFSLDSPGDAPFSLDDIDFGDELTSVAVQQVNPDDLKPSQEILFAPLAEAKAKSADAMLTQAFLGEVTSDEQLPPPLSIPSRRKQSPLSGILIAIVVLVVISTLGYFGYSSLSTPKETAAPEISKIGVRAVKSIYLENAAVGEVLVISGEALNEYSKPRAALKILVTVFDATGQSVATKSTYGGNPLTKEQIESLPLDKIEAAMANQFGDSLANMEVAPGKSIPFVAVLAKLPEGAKDFSVQSAGSTVATGKQQ